MTQACVLCVFFSFFFFNQLWFSNFSNKHPDLTELFFQCKLHIDSVAILLKFDEVF